MVCCDECDEWFHAECVGLADSDVAEDREFVCVLCQSRRAKKEKRDEYVAPREASEAEDASSDEIGSEEEELADSDYDALPEDMRPAHLRNRELEGEREIDATDEVIDCSKAPPPPPPPPELLHFTCLGSACGVTLGVPQGVELVQCGVCGTNQNVIKRQLDDQRRDSEEEEEDEEEEEEEEEEQEEQEEEQEEEQQQEEEEEEEATKEEKEKQEERRQVDSEGEADREKREGSAEPARPI
jgi:hypothetical protein